MAVLSVVGFCFKLVDVNFPPFSPSNFCCVVQSPGRGSTLCQTTLINQR